MKPEVRGPKEGRVPKSEDRNPKAEGSFEDRRTRPEGRARFGLRISAFFRLSTFGFDPLLALPFGTRAGRERGLQSPKTETQCRARFGLRPSDFGLLSAFDLRASAFKLRPNRAVKPLRVATDAILERPPPISSRHIGRYVLPERHHQSVAGLHHILGIGFRSSGFKATRGSNPKAEGRKPAGWRLEPGVKYPGSPDMSCSASRNAGFQPA